MKHHFEIEAETEQLNWFLGVRFQKLISGEMSIDQTLSGKQAKPIRKLYWQRKGVDPITQQL